MTRLLKLFMRSSMTFACKNLEARCINGSSGQGRRLLVERSRCQDGRYRFFKQADKNNLPVLIGASLAAFFGFFQSEEEKEHELIKTIKRSILLIQKGEYKKAEQMLHVALRQAQSIQSEDGITYVHDVMANLAFEIGDYEKAEKLFKSVMQRILAAGTPQEDMKIIHMSLKMAKIFEFKREFEKAELGYKHCIGILKKHIDSGTEDLDIKTLWAVALDWYAHLLLAQAKFAEALKYMLEAYELCVQINGMVHEQTVVLLNDLGSITFTQGKYDEALDYLSRAVKIGDELPDMEDLASIYVNLGNIFIKKGLFDEAKKSCAKGWRLSKSKKNEEALNESEACLDEVEKLLKS